MTSSTFRLITHFLQHNLRSFSPKFSISIKSPTSIAHLHHFSQRSALHDCFRKTSSCHQKLAVCTCVLPEMQQLELDINSPSDGQNPYGKPSIKPAVFIDFTESDDDDNELQLQEEASVREDLAVSHVFSQATKKRKFAEYAEYQLPDLAASSENLSGNSDDDELIGEPVSTQVNGSSIKTPAKKISQENKASRNRLPVIERKRIFVFKRPEKLTRAMQDWVAETYDLLDPFREDEDCWIHPKAQRTIILPSGVERARGHISKNFTWTDERGSHSLTVNFGIVAKLVERKITRRQKDGFITQGWHLSHLCGNFSCMNAGHTTVESASINTSRNYCFSHRGGCLHHPPCMKDKKLALRPDGQVSSEHAASLVVESNFSPCQSSHLSFDYGEHESVEHSSHFSDTEAYMGADDEDSF